MELHARRQHRSDRVVQFSEVRQGDDGGARGGILISNDEKLIDRAQEILDQEAQAQRQKAGFTHYTLGTKITASRRWRSAVLIAQLERLPEQNRRRARNVAIIREACLADASF